MSEATVRKVRTLEMNSQSQLVRVEDEDGNDFFVPRKRVHLVGGQHYLSTERQAILMRHAEERRAYREKVRQAKQKLAAEEVAA